jgi:uncharacterized membrane protein
MFIVALLSEIIPHIETSEKDMRQSYNTLTYLIGCSILGYVLPVNHKNDVYKDALPKSAHDVFIFQAKLGKWNDWVGLNEQMIQKKMNSILNQTP